MMRRLAVDLGNGRTVWVRYGAPGQWTPEDSWQKISATDERRIDAACQTDYTERMAAWREKKRART